MRSPPPPGLRPLLVPIQRAAVRRLLVTIKHMLAVEWSPSLLDVVPVLLTYMPESCVYGVVEELWGMRPLFFPHSEEEFEAWAATFKVRCGVW